MKGGTPKTDEIWTSCSMGRGAWGMRHVSLQAALRCGLPAEWTDVQRVKGSGVEKRHRWAGPASPALLQAWSHVLCFPVVLLSAPLCFSSKLQLGFSFHLWRPNTRLTLRTNLGTNTLQFYKLATGWGGLLLLHHCTLEGPALAGRRDQSSGWKQPTHSESLESSPPKGALLNNELEHRIYQSGAETNSPHSYFRCLIWMLWFRVGPSFRVGKTCHVGGLGGSAWGWKTCPSVYISIRNVLCFSLLFG